MRGAQLTLQPRSLVGSPLHGPIARGDLQVPESPWVRGSADATRAGWREPGWWGNALIEDIPPRAVLPAGDKGAACWRWSGESEGSW